MVLAHSTGGKAEALREDMTLLRLYEVLMAESVWAPGLLSPAPVLLPPRGVAFI